MLFGFGNALAGMQQGWQAGEDRQALKRERALNEQRNQQQFDLGEIQLSEAQKQAKFGEFKRNLDNAMGRLISTQGGDYAALQDVYNSGFPDGNQVAIQPAEGGGYQLQFSNGTTTAVKDWKELGRLAASMADPNAYIQAEREAQQKEAEARQKIELEERKLKNLLKRDEVKYGYDRGLEGLRNQNALTLADRNNAARIQAARLRQGPGGLNPTTRMRELAAAGLVPGTPEYQEAMLQAIAPRGTRLVVGPDGEIKYEEVSSQRPLTAQAINQIAETGSAFEDFDRLYNTFDDDYAGYRFEVVGDLDNWRKRVFGDESGQAQWWQDYQTQKNIIRNQLFGSALTATEKAEFDKSTISPGMDPDQVEENLGRQYEAAKRAAVKVASAWRANGYSEDAIRAALGNVSSLLDSTYNTANTPSRQQGGSTPQRGLESPSPASQSTAPTRGLQLPSTPSSQPPTSGATGNLGPQSVLVPLPDGTTAEFPNQQAADAFKRDAGIP